MYRFINHIRIHIYTYQHIYKNIHTDTDTHMETDRYRNDREKEG